MSSRRRVQRRDFLKGMAGAAGAAILAGCGPKAAPTAAPTGEAAPAAATTASTVAATATPAIKYADKACIHRHMVGGFTAGPDDQLVKEIQEQALREQYSLNVDVKFESANWSDFDNLITTRIETKGVDSVYRDGSSLNNWLSEPGLLKDFDEQIRQYGPNLLKTVPKAVFDYFDRGDGKICAVASWYEVVVDCEYICIRRDWCDQIGREVPQTIEDLIGCLRLFKERKLGGDVTIPLTSQLGGWMIPSYVLTGPFAPEPAEGLKMMENGEDLEYEYGCAMREQRLELLRQLHQDGLLNPEWATFKEEDTWAAVEKGMVGCMLSGYWAINGRLLTTEKEIDPKQDWVQIYPPVALKGVPNTGRILCEVPMNGGMVVTSWAPCPEAFIALADWINSSWENWMLAMYGIEGKHWRWGENGCFVDLRSNPPNQEYSGMRRFECNAFPWASKFLALPVAPGKEPKDPLADRRVREKIIYTRPQTNVPQQGEYPAIAKLGHFVPYKFAESAKFEPDLRALRDEHATKIIKGEMPVTDGIKAFWEQWMAAGGETRIKEVTEQWAKYAQAHPEMADPKVYFSPENWNTEIKYPDRPKR